MKNKAKLKQRSKQFRKKLLKKPKPKKGFSYGRDGKLHKKVFRKGVRKHK